METEVQSRDVTCSDSHLEGVIGIEDWHPGVMTVSQTLLVCLRSRGSGGEITEWRGRSFLLFVPWSPRTQSARVVRTSWASGRWDDHCVYRWAHLAQQGKGTCRRSNSELGLFACVGLSLPEAQLFIDIFFPRGACEWSRPFCGSKWTWFLITSRFVKISISLKRT